jgi:TIR domain
MTTIFVSHAKEDTESAEQIRQGLEAPGYKVWREPTSLSLESILYPRTIENVILGSAAVLLIWSSSAVASEWVERHILFSQRLKKLIVPVVIDDIDLPATLIVETIIPGLVPYTDVVKHLPPNFPRPDSADPLITLSEQAAHEFIRERKDAIDKAAEMLKQNEHREEVLAILEYLAHNDQMIGVREKAQEVLDADAKKGAAPSFRSDESRYIIGVRCKNGHVTYFDKRRICNDQVNVIRVMGAGVELDQRDLTCGTCGAEMSVRLDCRGYR